jgi:hypothetical protein
MSQIVSQTEKPISRSQNNSPLLVISETGAQDLFLAIQMFMASSAADAAVNAQEVLARAQASRAVNDAKKTYQAKGVQNKDAEFEYSKDEAGKNGLFQNWLNRFAIIDKNGRYTPNPTAIPSYSQADVDKMVNLRSAMVDGKLTAEEKGTLDNIMGAVWTIDQNGQAVISDEIMTIMLQQANALYQNWINGTQRLTSAETDLLKELIRSL